MSETPPHNEADSSDAEKEPKALDAKEELSPVLARLIEEVRKETTGNPHAYDRMHNRHNRSR